jgi:hypothetical protein
LEEAANYFLPKSNITAAQLRSFLTSGEFRDLNFVVKDGYLFTSNDQGISSRCEKEQLCAAKLESAASFANLVTRLVPFIRTVAVTGSVAYGSADKWDDVDLFVVTERNRLWISTFLALVQIRLYKVFGLKPAHLLPFCLSYVHDEDSFANETRRNRSNALFARELLKAKPVAGVEWYRKILEENNWVSEFYSASYHETLGTMRKDPDGIAATQEDQKGLRSFFLDWVNSFAFVTLSRYLRLRAYLTNLKLKSEGNNIRAFEPLISSASCVYTSNFYRWLSALWGD